jgi:hypothetical protein
LLNVKRLKLPFVKNIGTITAMDFILPESYDP